MEWLSTAIILLILAGIVALIIISMVKKKKSGKNSCGCSCGSCPMSGSCHSSAKKGK